MKISIITVVLNRKDSILRAMNSVINQKYENMEYIVLDGGSTDGTFELLKFYEDKIDILKSEKDRNLYDALNKAMKLSSGDIIGFMHSDDYYYDDNESKVHTRAIFHPAYLLRNPIEKKKMWDDVLEIDNLISKNNIRR